MKINSPYSIMVPPQYLNDFIKKMNEKAIKYEMIFEDVQELIDHTMPDSSNETNFEWTRYHALSEINDWLNDLPKKYPGKVEAIIGGRSYEGREIKGVKISFKKNNPGIFIEGGIHASEWISVSTATYLINEVLTCSESNVRTVLESYDWYIFPLFNPDGYEYTHTTVNLSPL